MAVESIEPIKFPILFRFDDVIVPSGIDFVRIWNFKHLKLNKYITKETVRPEAQFNWLIDADGKFREIIKNETMNTWSRPLRYIINLVKVIYEVKPGRNVKINELLRAIEGAREDSEKSSTIDFREYLLRYGEDVLFTKEMFLEFMHEPMDQVFELYPGGPWGRP